MYIDRGEEPCVCGFLTWDVLAACGREVRGEGYWVMREAGMGAVSDVCNIRYVPQSLGSFLAGRRSPRRTAGGHRALPA